MKAPNNERATGGVKGATRAAALERCRLPEYARNQLSEDENYAAQAIDSLHESLKRRRVEARKLNQDAAARKHKLKVIRGQQEVATKLANGRQAEWQQSYIALYHGTGAVASLYKLLVRLHQENVSSKIKIDCAEIVISVQRKSHAREMELMSVKCAALKRNMAALCADYDE